MSTVLSEGASRMSNKVLTFRDPPTALTPMDMLDRALAQGANVEVMEKLMGLQERWETNNARKAYNDAIAQARAEIPVIFKSNEKTGIGGSATSTRILVRSPGSSTRSCHRMA